MMCHGCCKEIGDRKAYVNDRGRGFIYHPACAPGPEYELGRVAGFAEAIEKAAKVADEIEDEGSVAFIMGEVAVHRSVGNAIRAIAIASTMEEK